MKRKDYWWSNVRNMLSYYPIKDESLQAAMFNQAVAKSLEEAKQLPDGELRIRLINAVYIHKSHTVNGGAMNVNVSRRTACRWLNSFIRSVARNAGYL